MARHDAHLLQSCYSGTPAEKLAQARTLLAKRADGLPISPLFCEELDRLHRCVQALNDQMRTMRLGQLCSACAARPGGGCCSAFMADNTDSLQILINQLLGVEVTIQESSGENCCFLGPQGCLFLAKPIFCLNYNCTHILDSDAAEDLTRLYQRAADVLSQQTKIEGLLVEELRTRTRPPSP